MSKLIQNSVELTKLVSALHTTSKGTKCILIPIDQTGIKLTEKNQVFLNFTTWLNEQADQYGNICSNQLMATVEQVAAGQKGTYIGNGKEPKPKTNTPSAPAANNEKSFQEDKDDDLPF